MEIREPIDKKKKLNIIAVADASEYGRSSVLYGIRLSKVFDASLTVIANFGFSLEQQTTADLSSLKKETESVCEICWREDYFFPERLYTFAEDTNTIMFVIGVDATSRKALFNKRRAMRFIKPSRLPVMTVGNVLPFDNAFQHVLLPVDIERQAKEKALWAGYFSRFYNATIHILHTEYEDEGLQNQLQENIAFVEKLYHNLEIKYVQETVPNHHDMDAFSIEYARQVEATLTVVMMTRYYTLADLLMGPHEKNIIGNNKQFPVLCINQRDDLYVLCT